MSERENVTLPSGAALKIAEKVLGDADLGPLREVLDQRGDRVDLTTHWAEAPIIRVQVRRTIVVEAFGNSAATVECGYGLPSPETLFPAPEDTGPLIDACTERLHLPFRDAFAAHLGGFDLFRLGPQLDGPNPFRSGAFGARDGRPGGIRVWRGVFGRCRHVAHLTAESDGEVVLDQAFVLRGCLGTLSA